VARALCRRVVAVLALAAGITTGADATPVRVFLVQHKHRLDDATSVARFRAKMLALVDAGERGGEPTVQAGIDDVASHLAARDPSAPAAAVVHFPDATGLDAALIGSRGTGARAADNAFAAFAGLLGAYAAQTEYYDARFPSLAGQPIRSLQLALSDVLYRAVYETFRDIARRYGVYVSVNLDAAPARRVEESEDPERVRLLRDPDAVAATYAYEAVSDLPQNVVWLFDPEGEVLVPDRRGGLLRSPSATDGVILPSAAKVYLTPIEQGLDKPGGGLSLASASARDLEVLPTEVGAIGVVVSKDAWMVDVNERLEAKGASFLLQSEAFDVWAFDVDPWAPDGFLQGGYFQLQEKGGFLFNATPSLTGNLFEITFDGQSALLAKVRRKLAVVDGGAAGFIGQPRRGGFVRVSPWIVSDPPPGVVLPPGDSLSIRRSALVEHGRELRPGAGMPCSTPVAVGACENGYREAIVWADLDLPEFPWGAIAPRDRSRRATSFGASRAVASSATGQQRRPRAAASGDTVAVVWDDGRSPPYPQVYLAVSRDAGRSFGAPIRVSDAATGARVEMFADIAIGADRIHVVWQAFADGFDDDRAAIELARFTREGEKVGVDVRVDGDDAPPAGRWQPRVALLDGGDPYVVWLDERDGGPDRVALAHVYGARGEEGGARFGAAARIDAGEPVALAASLDNRWSPTLAASGDALHVAWTDFRSFDWDIHVTRSIDGGASFAASQEVSSSCFFCDAPRFVVAGPDRLWLAWTDLRAGPPDANLSFVESRDAGTTFSAHVPLDDSRRGHASALRGSSQSHVAFAATGARVYAAWQDDRAGNNDILFARVEGFPRGVLDPERVDDSGTGASNQYRPELVIAAKPGETPRCIVFWEDDRDGRLQIFTASRSCLRTSPTLPHRPELP
jgi:hypothetical protein